MYPRNMDEFNEEFQRQSKVTGTFMETTQHVPCPWCAFKDFWLLRPFQGVAQADDRPNIDAQMANETTCRRCHRTGKCIITRDENGVKAEFVQTGGPQPPEWLVPPPRLLTEDENAQSEN